MGFSCTHEKRYFIGRYLILGVWPHACFLFKQHLSWRKEKEIKIWIIIRATVSWLWTVLACGPCWGLIGKLVSWHDLQIKKIIKKKKNFSRSVNQKAYGGMVHHVVGPASGLHIWWVDTAHQGLHFAGLGTAWLMARWPSHFQSSPTNCQLYFHG